MISAISIVDYMHELKDAGFTARQSEVQAKKIEQVVTEMKTELATKKDLELVIEKLRYESLRFIVWTGVGVVLTLGSMMTGMLAKGFHWF